MQTLPRVLNCFSYDGVPQPISAKLIGNQDERVDVRVSFAFQRHFLDAAALGSRILSAAVLCWSNTRLRPAIRRHWACRPCVCVCACLWLWVSFFSAGLWAYLFCFFLSYSIIIYFRCWRCFLRNVEMNLEGDKLRCVSVVTEPMKTLKQLSY